ncbi:MAG: hypothetical protein ACRDJC_16295 [Thermomicrobiales bacterium]
MIRFDINLIRRARAGHFWLVGLGVAMAALVSGSGPILAHEAHGHPVRIHAGTCDDLGAVAFRLTGVGASVDLDNAPVATPEAVNSDRAYQMMAGESIIDGTIEGLLADDHAVMIYESDEEMDAIACGNIGGAMSGDTLITGLGEMGVAGHSGFALFQPEGDRLAVSVILGHALAPVSASGSDAEQEHTDAEGEEADDHEHEEEDGHDAVATPEA